MDQQSLKFGEFNFDSDTYSIAINAYVEEKDTENVENFKKSFNQLGTSIMENSERCSQAFAEICKIQTNNGAMREELDILKEEEERLTLSDFDLKDG